MDPFEYARSWANLWAAGGQAMLSMQGAALKATAAGSVFPDFSSEMTEMTRASQAVAELYSASTTLSHSLLQHLPKPRAEEPTVDATFQKLADPRTWLSVTGEMDEVLGRMSDGPRFSDLWNVERKYTRLTSAWFGVRQRGLEQTAVVLQAWQRAAQAFTEQLALGGKTPASAEAAFRLWTETANRVLLEMERSTPFLEAQAALIRASTELRLAQHELMEYYGERFGFPTRRELDDVYKTVTDLKREVRALRRAGAAPPVERPPVQIQVAPKPRPRRKEQ